MIHILIAVYVKMFSSMELCALIHDGNIFYCRRFCEFVFCRTRVIGVRLVVCYNNLCYGMLHGSN